MKSRPKQIVDLEYMVRVKSMSLQLKDSKTIIVKIW